MSGGGAGSHVIWDWPMASWVVVTLGPLCEHTHTTEDVTFPQLRWRAVTRILRHNESGCCIENTCICCDHSTWSHSQPGFVRRSLVRTSLCNCYVNRFNRFQPEWNCHYSRQRKNNYEMLNVKNCIRLLLGREGCERVRGRYFSVPTTNECKEFERI